jgi:multidrug resistance efflux pump
MFYSNVHLLKVESAVISGKTEVISSPSKGILAEIYVREEDEVNAGEPLFRIDDPEIQKEIEGKKNEILKNRALLREKQKRLWALESRLENYKKNFSLRLKVQEKIIQSLGEKIDLLNEELEKKTRLYERKLVSKPEIDGTKRELLGLEQELALANYEYYRLYENINNPESGTNPAIRERDDSGSLKAEIERIKDIIAIDEKELSYIRSINEQNTVKASFNGALQKVSAFEGKYVDERTPVVLLKDISGEKFVEAYLTENEALKLKLGQKAKINIPSRDIELKGRLVKLEKRPEFLGKNIVIAVVQPETPELLMDINDGTPAKVAFIRNKLFKTRYTLHG